MKRTQSGFTLIEIAIVLVIIGLLLGGVLKGQELINQAKIKNVAKDFEAISVGVLGYQDRYKKLPGDDDGAARWSGVAVPATGAGNGTISGAFNSTTATDETALFWQHLRLAGFIAGDTSTTAEATKQPPNAVGGILGIQSGVFGLAGHAVCSTQLPGKIAGAVDSQFDDGKPESGSVRGFTSTTVTAANNPAITVYTDDTSTLYTVCRTL